MKKLTDYELKCTKAGSAGWVIAGVTAGITFLIGVLDGYVRPFKCR